MGRLAVMMSTDDLDGPMSPHFGKAEWIMVVEVPSGVAEFARNEGFNGGSAADLLISRGCTDVILADIGKGALARLQAANIRAWAAPGPVTGNEALQLFAEGHLSPVPTARTATRHGHGCCCASSGDTRASAHCRG